MTRRGATKAQRLKTREPILRGQGGLGAFKPPESAPGLG